MPRPNQICQDCTASFTPRGARGPLPIYCPQCKYARQLKNDRRYHGRALDITQRQCFRCGVVVGPYRRACDECVYAQALRHNHIRRGQARDGEFFTPREIFERDRWTCGICGGRVSKRKSTEGRSSWPSIDHIIPLSRGGEHSRANVQLAHLGCNSGKCDRSAGEQLRLL